MDSGHVATPNTDFAVMFSRANMALTDSVLCEALEKAEGRAWTQSERSSMTFVGQTRAQFRICRSCGSLSREGF